MYLENFLKMKTIINNKKYQKYIVKTSDSIITFSEKRSKYVLNNKNKRLLYKLIIDNGIIKTGVKCDSGIYYELNNNTNGDKSLYLIELKGIDVEYAFMQLLKTYEWFTKKIKNNINFKYRIRVVCTKVCKGIEIKQGKKKFIKYGISDIIVKEHIEDTIN